MSVKILPTQRRLASVGLDRTLPVNTEKVPIQDFALLIDHRLDLKGS